MSTIRRKMDVSDDIEEAEAWEQRSRMYRERVRSMREHIARWKKGVFTRKEVSAGWADKSKAEIKEHIKNVYEPAIVAWLEEAKQADAKATRILTECSKEVEGG